MERNTVPGWKCRHLKMDDDRKMADRHMAWSRNRLLRDFSVKHISVTTLEFRALRQPAAGADLRSCQPGHAGVLTRRAGRQTAAGRLTRDSLPLTGAGCL